MNRRAAFLLFATMMLAASCAIASVSKPAPAAPPAARSARVEVATFAMGCFWCGETQFEHQPGVLSVVSGYCGGSEQHPTYEQVGAGETGHYESVQVKFDPTRTSYAKLLDIFWHAVDPTQGDGQFCDRGAQYRSAVFVHDGAQRQLADSSRRAIEGSGVLKAPIVTQLLPATTFWPAEDYHQDFWKKDPVRYRSYRFGCGRDQRLAKLWGAAAAKPLVH